MFTRISGSGEWKEGVVVVVVRLWKNHWARECYTGVRGPSGQVQLARYHVLIT